MADSKVAPKVTGKAAHRPNFFFSDNFKWLVATIAIPLSTAVYGYYQTQQAEARLENEKRLNDARNNVAALTALLPSLADTDPKKARLALIVLGQLKLAQRDKDSLVNASAAITELEKIASPEAQRQVAQLREDYSAASGATVTQAPTSLTQVRTATVASAAEAKPRIVYLQIYGAAQRSAASEVQALLRDNGIGAPGIEDVSGKLAGRMSRATPPQIRYFSDGDIGSARWLASHLPKAQGQDWSVVRAQAKGVPMGQLELWWPYSPGG